MSARIWQSSVCCVVTILALALNSVAAEPDAAAASSSASPLVLVVMDPLAKELSCPCVKGYAQRDYNQLAALMKTKLGRDVIVEFRESLIEAQRAQPEGLHVIIGKKSVVEFDAKAQNIKVTPIASLTGKDGKTTQQGFIVVPSKDPANTLGDLKNYRIIFGPAECDEKHAAPMALLKQNGVSIPQPLETCSACSDGATKILELGADVRAATVISSYAAPLLEGCGTIQKGDLRVVGKTEPVPFITAFTTEKMNEQENAQVRSLLLEIGENRTLSQALETQLGFVELDPSAGIAKKK